MSQAKLKVLFVCLGNICRSPTADGVFRQKVKDAGLDGVVEVDSAGTAAYHVGESPDARATQAASRRGYDLSKLRARQAVANDFEQFDYVLAMDNSNLSNLQRICPRGREDRLHLFLERFGSHSENEVPDPYYGGDDGFEHVLDLIEEASDALLADIQERLR